MLFFVARHHTPQDTLPGQAHSGTIKLIKQQDMLRRTTVFPAQTAAFVMAETVLVDQEEAHLNAKRGGPAFQQATLTLQQLTLFTVEPGLMAHPDIQVGRAALPDRGGAAHGVNAGNRQLALRRVLRRHTAVQLKFVQIVALGFIRRVEANTAGNVTIKVTRHQWMVIVQ